MAHFKVLTDKSYKDASKEEMRLLFDAATHNGTNPEWWVEEGRYQVTEEDEEYGYFSLSEEAEEVSFEETDYFTEETVVTVVQARKPVWKDGTPTMVWDFHY